MHSRTLIVAIGLVLLLPGCTCGPSDARRDSDVATDAGPSTDAAGPGDAASPSDSAIATDAGAGGDGGGAAVTYRAVALVGALDRVVLVKLDPAADTCVRVRVVTPPVGGAIGVTTPAGWSVEYAEATTVAGCDDLSSGGGTMATSGMGSVTFGPTSPGGIYPCTVDVDATLDFPPPWPTAVETLVATALPVEGTGC